MFEMQLSWWITAIEVPVISALFWMVWRGRAEADEALQRMREVMESRHAQMREALAGFKLEVAKNYASIGDMKELEMRLVAHLLRIEAKLDTTAMKTEVLHAREG